MNTPLLSASVLTKVLKDMVAEPCFAEKLGWWLLFGASTERWFQFELGFRLHKYLGDEYAVGYEQRRVDLVVYRAMPLPTPVEGFKPLFNLEIKVQGNWYAKPAVFTKIAWDRDKISKLDVEQSVAGAALVFWFVAEPTKDGRHAWIIDQVQRYEKKNNSLRTLEQISERMSACGEGFELLGSLPVPSVHQWFERLDLHLYCYRSGVAKKKGFLQPTA